MKISLGTVHAGFRYKESVKTLFGNFGYEVVDYGTYNELSCDYPEFVRSDGEAAAKGDLERGIVFGGSGIWEP